MRPQPNAVERLRRNIRAELEKSKELPRAYRKSQEKLAEEVGLDSSTVSQALKEDAPQDRIRNAFPLKHLDAVAAYLQVPPSTLVKADDTTLIELTQNEHRVVLHWRTFPVDVQDQVLALFDYFAGLLPEEKDERRWWLKIRRITHQSDRAAIERAIDDVLHAQRSDKGGNKSRAAEGSSRAKASTTRLHRGQRAE